MPRREFGAPATPPAPEFDPVEFTLGGVEFRAVDLAPYDAVAGASLAIATADTTTIEGQTVALDAMGVFIRAVVTEPARLDQVEVDAGDVVDCFTWLAGIYRERIEQTPPAVAPRPDTAALPDVRTPGVTVRPTSLGELGHVLHRAGGRGGEIGEPVG